MDSLTLTQARRVAVAAQGLGSPRSAVAPGLRQVRGVAERIGALQIDSVSVVARAHHLPLFSRLGSYDTGLLARLAYGDSGKPGSPKPGELDSPPRGLHETWAHEASYVPVSLEPALRWRQTAFRAKYGRPELCDSLLALIASDGAVAPSDLEKRVGAGSWWGWSATKDALENMFRSGELAVAGRRSSFERVYDLPFRVLPAAVLGTPTPTIDGAFRVLLMRAAALLGVGTARDLADVFRLKGPAVQKVLRSAVAAGELHAVGVEGWKDVAYVLPGLVVPRRVTGAALLAPFDPLVWFRPRVERMWQMRMRLEIYTPAHRRVHGYYVLPFLLGSTLVARVDLKADRAAGVLRVLASHAEPGVDHGLVAEALTQELRLMAEWLGLSDVHVMPVGDLAPALTAACHRW